MTESLSRLELFAADLKEEVRIKCQPETGTPPLQAEAFTSVALEHLIEHNEASDGTLCAWEDQARGRTPAAKLSAWSLSGDGATLDLFVTLYLNEDAPTLVTRADTEQQFKLLRGFLRRALDGWHTKLEPSFPVFEAARQIYEAREALTTARLFLLTDGVVKSVEIEQEQIEGLELRYVMWDLDKLSRLQVGEREVIELDFVNAYGGPVPALETADATGEYRTFLAFLPAPVLARIYGEHGQRLLERNVRAFLQAKGKINKGLQKTLQDEPHRFLAYNNGLCCTAASVEVDAKSDGHVRLRAVRDFQIVNGGQTTASIFHALKREKTDVGHVVVQVKLTVLTNPERVADIVPLISKYANSQNKVNAADFSANGRFHLELEKLSRTVWAPAVSGLDRGTHWYYERARGSYLDDKMRQGTPARIRDWEKQNPSIQKFTKTDLAKYEQLWAGLPHLVCRGAEKNFIQLAQRHEDEGEPVVDVNYFKQVVAKMILFKAALRLAPKDSGSLRAQAVAYTVAWLVEKSGRRIDLNQLWERQSVPETLAAALTSVGAKALAYIKALPGNPTEAAKKEETWQKFHSTPIALDAPWERALGAHAFVAPRSDLEAVEREWDRARQSLLSDQRTIMGLAVRMGRDYPPNSGGWIVGQVAALTWKQLQMKPGFGPKKVRQIVTLFSAATER
ncbi:AIPR family protein [Horticoccus luteus]|uniref:AIPR family protein n=1 Tax=Horticoccus luteus TaxID=2862869 RepID=A0A8F9XH54_9BACT|nr:AIPR family protein [Horticoccus luteus]QYM78955.1 AIPR family protein [Horticoccus luteus]